MPIETTSDFKKQLLLTRLHGVQASEADDREIDRKEKKNTFLARGVIQSGLQYRKINRMAACRTGWKWVDQM